MPNALAYLALIVWPFIAYIIVRRFPIGNAAVLLFLVPYLYMPVDVGFDTPGLPPLNKETLPALVALILLKLRYPHLRILSNRDKLPRNFLILMVLGVLGTVASNPEPLLYGPLYLPGFGLKDMVSTTFLDVCRFFIPFWVGYTVLTDPSDQKTLLSYIVVGLLVYSIPVAWEVRMSPQLHTQIYGFFPHAFDQQMRQGGFRPVVFLGHGLIVAMFVLIGTVAALALWKFKESPMRRMGSLKMLWISFIVVICKTAAVYVYGVFASFIILFLRAKLWPIITAMVALVIFVYPIFRSMDIVPTESIVRIAKSYSADRGRSLEFRILNEDVLLQRANEKPVFGWGGWGRNSIYDFETGQEEAISDGVWIIVFGQRGWTGYLVVIGILCLPLFLLFRERKRLNLEHAKYTFTLALILTFYLIDQIPNSSSSSLTYIIAGSIAGYINRAKDPEITRST